MSKTAQIAELLLRPQGCTYSEIKTATGWSAVSVQFHAKENGLRLRLDKQPGQPKRYFGYRPKITVRESNGFVVPVVQPPLPLPEPPQKKLRVPRIEKFCAAHDVTLVSERGTVIARCQRCLLGFPMPNATAVPRRIARQIQHHADFHRRQLARKNGSS